MKRFFKLNGLWLALFTVADCIFILLTWLIRPAVFAGVSLFILLFSALIIALGYVLESRRQKRIREAVRKFVESTDEKTGNALKLVSGSDYGEIIDEAYDKLQKQTDAIRDSRTELMNYREYIEAWTHEIKTPLSLMTLVMENHPEEMSPYVSQRFRYAQLQISQDVERILFYARLGTDHSDYVFTRFRLDECVREVLQSYVPLAQEKKTELITEMQPLEVVSDRKVLLFMLSQLVSNAVKYAAVENGRVTFAVRQDEKDAGIVLSVRDNGGGVPAEDLPFIFEKGFTGNHFERQKATGMGLYLVSKYAAALKIDVTPETELPEKFGFGIEFRFPYVEK